MSKNVPHDSRVPPTILVVDGDSGLLMVLAKFLRSRGYQVFACNSGECALEAWIHLIPKPRLLMTDMDMPGISGRELAISLRRLQPGIKVLFVTHSSSVETGEVPVQVSNARVIAKPFRFDRLQTTVETVLAEP